MSAGSDDLFIKLSADAAKIVTEAKKAADALALVRREFASIKSVTTTFNKEQDAVAIKLQGITRSGRAVIGSLTRQKDGTLGLTKAVTDSATLRERAAKRIIDQNKRQLDLIRQRKQVGVDAENDLIAAINRRAVANRTSTDEAKKAATFAQGLAKQTADEIIAQRKRGEAGVIAANRQTIERLRRQSATAKRFAKETADEVIAQRTRSAQGVIAANRQALSRLRSQTNTRKRFAKEVADTEITQQKRADQIVIDANQRTLNILRSRARGRRELSRIQKQASDRAIADTKQEVSAEKDLQTLLRRRSTLNRGQARDRGQAAVTREIKRLIAERKKLTTETNRNAAAANRSARSQVRNAREVGEAVKRTRATVQSLTISWRSFIRLVAVQVAHRAIAALSALFRQSLSDAKKFSIGIAEVQTISQENALTTDEWANGLRELSDSFSLDVLEQTEAAYQALSNQVVDSTDAFGFLRQANFLAETTLSTTSEAVGILSSAINAFKLPVTDANKISAQFFKTIELGRLRLRDIADTFGNVAVPAAQLGISLAETNAAIAQLSIRGVPAATSLTFLRNLLLKMIKPTNAMKELFSDLGVASGEGAIESFRLAGFLELVEKRTRGSSTEIAKLFGRIRAITPAMVFAGKGAEELADKVDQITNASESFGKATDIIFKSVGKRIDIELSKIRNLFTQDLGTPALKAILEITDAMGGLAVVVKSFTQVALAGLIGGMTVLAASFAVIAATNPFIGFPALIVGATVALNTFRLKAENDLRNLTNARQKATDRQVEAAKDSATAIAEAISKSLSGTAVTLNKEIAAVVSFLNEQQRTALENIKQLNKLIEDDHKRSVDILKGQIKELATAEKDALNIITGINTTIAGLETKLDRVKFEFEFDEADFEDQLNILVNRGLELQARRPDLTTAAEVNTNFAEEEEILRRLTKLQAKGNADNKKAIETERELNKKAVDLDIAAQRKLIELRRRLRSTRSIEARRRINVQIVKINQDQVRKLKDIQAELGKIQKFNFQEIDTQKAITDNIAGRIASLKLLAAAQKVIAEDAKKARLEESESLILFEESFRKVQKFDLSKLFETGNISTIIEGLADVGRAGEQLLRSETARGSNSEKLARIEERNRQIQIAGERKLAVLRVANAKKLVVENRKLAEQFIKDKTAELKAQAEVDSKIRGSIRALEIFTTGTGGANRLAELFGFQAGQSNPVIEGLTKLIKESDTLEPTVERLTRLRDILAAVTKQGFGQVPTGLSPEQRNQIQAAREAVTFLQQSLADQGVVEFVQSETIGSNIANQLEAVGRSLKLVDENGLLIKNSSAAIKKGFEDQAAGADTLSEAIEKLTTQQDVLRQVLAQTAINDTDSSDQQVQTIRSRLRADPELKEEIKIRIEGSRLLDDESSATELKEAGQNIKEASDNIQRSAGLLLQSVRQIRNPVTQADVFAKGGLVTTNRIAKYYEKGGQVKDSMISQIKYYEKGGKVTNNEKITSTNRLKEVIYKADGGFIPRGTDTIPAMLTPGEFVVNAGATKKFYSQLVSMNSGNIQNFQSGGAVSSTTNTTTVGDINITAPSNVDISTLGKLLKRGIRRGTIEI